MVVEDFLLCPRGVIIVLGIPAQSENRKILLVEKFLINLKFIMH